MYRVLIVDDDRKVLSGYRRILEPYVRVVTAESGAEAQKALADQGPFASVIVDYYLSDMLGVDLLADMAELAPETSRIMITGLPDVDVAIQAVNRGHAFRFLSKPCDADTLIDTLLAGVEMHVLCVADKRQVVFEAKTKASKVPEHQCHRKSSKPEYAKGLRLFYTSIGYYTAGRMGLACKVMAEAADVFATGKVWREHARASLWLAPMRTKLPEDQLPGDSPLAGFVMRSLRLADEQAPAAFTLEPDLLGHLVNWARQQGIESALVDGWLTANEQPTKVALRIHAMGTLRMYRDDREIPEDDWKTRKERMIFLYLLANRDQRVDREVLLEKFWPDYDRATAANNFSSLLYNVRNVVGSSVVSYKKGFCWLDKTQYWCDADSFADVRKLLMADVLRADLVTANARFVELRRLYAGDFLAEFRYEDWVTQEQIRMRDDYVLAILSFTELLISEGHLVEAEQTMMIAPLSKKYSHRVAGALVEILTKLGRSEAAERVVRNLSEEYLEEYGQNLRA